MVLSRKANSRRPITPPSAAQKRVRGWRCKALQWLLGIFSVVCVLQALNVFVFNNGGSEVSSLLTWSDESRQRSQVLVGTETNQKSDTKSIVATADDPSSSTQIHQVAGLSCDALGGPAKHIASDMVYWRDIPSDAHFESPFKKVGPEVKYLTFEPDEGGWNNIRMAMETAVTMALAMGRILVLPPEQGMYLLHKQEKGQKNRFTFKDFFHFDSVEMEHPALDVISFEDFLKREAMTGNLRNKETGAVSFPPNNRTNWDGAFKNYESGKKGVFPWVRTVSKTIDWSWDKCIAGFPKEPGLEAEQRLMAAFEEAKSKTLNEGWQERVKKYINNPTPVDAPPAERIVELLSSRNSLCMYDTSFQQAKFVHVMGDNDSGARMLSHFYAFLFFEDWHQDLWIKRFVRDHLRYIDELQCYAARYVSFLRSKAYAFGDPNGDFYTVHIRRGDFQYKGTRVPADQIIDAIRGVIPVNSTLYIATDEKDRTFFTIFGKYYRVYFLNSNPQLIEGLNSNFYGMLDQLIASRGKVFSGTYYSTFTGYIHRMRGYHSQKQKAPGWELGQVESYYYVPLPFKNSVKEYHTVQPPYWAREFPIGWRDIDKDVEEVDPIRPATP